MEPVEIPSRIDEPPHLLLWSLDELAPMLLGLIFGVLIGEAFLCLAAGFLVTSLYKRFRDSKPDGYLFHMIYWGGFWPSKSKSMKNPYVRRYLP